MSALALFGSSTFSDQVFGQGAVDAAIPLIYDTDIGNDVDDVLALGLIHALQSRGECELVAVTVSKDNPLAGCFVDCINTFYGRSEVPIGVVRNGSTPNEGKFIGLADQLDGAQLRYRHDFDPKLASDAVTVLRQALAAAHDGTVVIAQVGFSTNLARLLASEPDSISQLSGSELVREKVRLLSVMAGAFEQVRDSNGKMRDHKEFNIVKDIPSAQKLAAEWPTPIVWSGYEIGLAVTYPYSSIERDYGYVKHHPLAEAYRLYCPPSHDRPSWDLTSVLYAVLPEHDYFGLSSPGVVTIADDGITSFVPEKEGRHRLLTLSTAQRIRLTEALVQLCSQPPLHND